MDLKQRILVKLADFIGLEMDLEEVANTTESKTCYGNKVIALKQAYCLIDGVEVSE